MSVIASLFVFRNFYKGINKHRSILITIGSVHLSMFVIYYIINITFFYLVLPNYVNWNHFNLLADSINKLRPKGHPGAGNLPMSVPQDIVPFHISSAGEIFSSLLLITCNKKIFDYTFPTLGFIPIIAIIAPSKPYYDLNNYFYWEFFINHTLIIWSYWWFYLYGIKKFNIHSLRWNYISATSLSIVAFGYDYAFNTNLLFVGRGGYPIGALGNTSTIFSSDGKTVIPGSALLFIVGMGSLAVLIGYIIIISIKPFYELTENNIFKKNSDYSFKKGFLVIKNLFIWNRKLYNQSIGKT